MLTCLVGFMMFLGGLYQLYFTVGSTGSAASEVGCRGFTNGQQTSLAHAPTSPHSSLVCRPSQTADSSVNASLSVVHVEGLPVGTFVFGSECVAVLDVASVCGSGFVVVIGGST